MKNYTVKGLYNSYDKNHKERNALDYYSTPTKEVINILNRLKINFNNQSILEPCVGRRSYDRRNPDLFISNRYFRNYMCK